jgi:hypothetical protein
MSSRPGRPRAAAAAARWIGLALTVGAASAIESATRLATADTRSSQVAAPTACTVAHYSVLELPLRPVAINDRGDVLGTTKDHRAAVWGRRSGLRELPLPADFVRSEGISLNARDHVVAVAFDAGFTRSQAFFVADRVVTLLGGEKARAYQLNDHDVIVGEALLPGRTRSEPVLWMGGAVGRHGSARRLEPRPLGACCGGAAKGIDDRGRVIGDAYDEYGHYYAFSWREHGGLERIEHAHTFSSPVAMNRHGHALIETFPGVSLYSPAGLTPLALTRRPASHPRALNDCDVVVGGFGAFTDNSRAFAWDRSRGFVDLNERIGAAGWKLETATGINNRGEIVGHGDPPGRDDVGFLLLPDR